ncbi:hypothetical protein RN001_009282 [Aquatica leii]|uniref:Uncharacterized protein n=1 Tax=Aquatica leii TaxID=1421715 RepID=A0AAN7P7I0_9COLE|nr:hypothetical protein RN001_009282 [Aquatica leii]
MNYSQFLDQVEHFMHVQQNKNSVYVPEKAHYQWLTKKRSSLTFLSTKDEYMMRQALQKVNEHQKQQVIKRLLLWIEENPYAESHKVPEMCIQFLNNAHNINLINSVTIIRKHSFRRSLKRLAMLSSRVFPLDSTLSTAQKCVHFRDEATIFSITY